MMSGKIVTKFLVMVIFLAGCYPPERKAFDGTCETSTDCNSDLPFCSPDKKCVECLTTGDCSSCHTWCNQENRCELLSGRGDTQKYLSERQFCLPDNECEAGVNCCSLGYFCNIYTGQCLLAANYTTTCTTEIACPTGLLCDTYHNLCVPQPDCQDDLNCCTVHESIAGMPMSCASTGKCNAYQIVCTPPAGATSSCPYLPKQSDECAAGKFCVEPGICVQCTCDADCPEGSNLICNKATGLCKSAYACISSADCNSSSQICDLSTGRCVAKCSSDLECGLNEYCNSSEKMCRPESERPCEVDSYEVNDRIDTAFLLAEHPTIIEGVKCPDDHDWFKLSLKRADQVTIKIYETNDSTGTIYLDVYMPDGVTLAGSTNNGFFAKTITFTANDDGEYFLHVYTTSANSTLSYAVALSYGTGTVCEDLLEMSAGSNDSPDVATPIFSPYGSCRHDLGTANRATVVCESGETIICAGDKDYYSFHLPSGQQLQARLYGHSSPLAMMLLTADTHEVVAQLSASSNEQELTYVGRPGGEFLLVVAASGLEQSVYSLAITIWDGNKEWGCVEDQYDVVGYNDSFAASSSTKVVIPTGSWTINGNLCLGDRDVYRLQMNDGNSEIDVAAGYKLQLELSEDSDSAVSLSLYQEDGSKPVMVTTSSVTKKSVIMPVTDGNPVWAVIDREIADKTLSYTVKGNLVPPPACTDDGLNNQQARQAVTIGENNLSSLSLCSGERDWFTFTPKAKETVTLTVNYESSLPAPRVALYGPQILEALDPKDSSTWGGLVLEGQEIATGQQRIHLVEALGQPYYLLVENVQHWPLPNYEVALAKSYNSCEDDKYTQGGNSSAAQAYLLPVSKVVETSEEYHFFADNLTICDAAGEDWFGLKASSGDLMDITVIYQPGDGNLDLYLYPPAATIAGSAVQHVAYDWDDVAPYTGKLHIAYTVPSGEAEQVWPFVVRPYEALGTPRFNNLYALQVAISRNCVADSIGLTAPPAVLDGSSDSGYLTYRAQDFATYSPAAYPLDGSELSGTLSLCGNEDWLLIKIDDENSGTQNGLTVCAEFDHGAGDIDLEIYEASDLTTPVAESATKRNNEGIILTSPLKMGYYYLRVFLDSRDNGKKSSYRLRVFGGSSYEQAGCR